MLAATNGTIPSLPSTAGTNLCMNTRSMHYSPLDKAISGLVVAYANWYVAPSTLVETDGPNAITVRAAIEYPAGVYTPLMKNGSRDLTITAATASFDPCGVTIPANTRFYIRTLVSVANTSMVWPIGRNTVSANGEGAASAASYTDLTTSGTITANVIACYAPLSIAGNLSAAGQGTAGQALLIVGDSIADGTGDAADVYGNLGYIARALSNNFPYAKLTRGGDGASFFELPSNSARRLGAVTGLVSHAVVEFGINDVTAGASLAVIQANLLAVWAALAGMGLKVFQCTISPYTTSTDNWATAGNQTVSANEAVRVGLNTWIRSVPYPLAGYFESADMLETVRNSGLWKSNGVAFGYTIDGRHPSTLGHSAALASVNLALVAIPASRKMKRTYPCSGTFVPTPGAISTDFEIKGGGAAGGSSLGAGSGAASGAGGGSGAYCAKTGVTATAIGQSLPFTVGQGGQPAVAGNNAGNNGSASTVLGLTAGGGIGGAGGSNSTANGFSAGAGGDGGQASGGDVNVVGETGQVGLVFGSTPVALTGQGGGGVYGSGGKAFPDGSAGTNGNPGSGYGAGGTGAASTTASKQGGAGTDGVFIATESL